MGENIFINVEKPLHEIINFIDQVSYLQTEENIPYQIPLILGKPGGGKTMSIEDMAHRKNDEFFSSHFALMALEELGGIPQFKNEFIQNENMLTTVWSLPEFVSILYRKSDIAKTRKDGGIFIKNKYTDKVIFGIPNVQELSDSLKLKYNFNEDLYVVEKVTGDKKPHRVILLLDDIHRCDLEHQTALMEILSEKKIKGYAFPQNVAIILAGNFSNIAGFKNLLSPVVNRCMFLYVKTDFNHWKKNFALKHDIHPVILAFLSAYPNLFHTDEENNSPWASPRSWTNFSNILTLLERKNKKLPISIVSYFTFAHLGQSVSEKFAAFYKLFNEYETNEIFDNVKTKEDFYKYINKYKDYNKQYSLSYACINYLLQNYSEKNKNKLLNVIKCIIEAYNSDNYKMSELSTTIIKEMTIIFSSNSKKYRIGNFFDSLISLNSDGESEDILISSINNNYKYVNI